jgi:hypothetical protein
VTCSGSSRVATLKSIVSGWCLTCIASGVPQTPQKMRQPKSLEAKRFTLSLPLITS